MKKYKPKLRMLAEEFILFPIITIYLLLKPETLNGFFEIESLKFMGVVAPYLPYALIGWLIYKIIFVLRLEYTMNEKGNMVKVKGVIGRFRQDLPFNRITNVHKNISWKDRILGLTQIQIQTAGSSDIEMTLNGLSMVDGDEIYEDLKKFKGLGDAT